MLTVTVAPGPATDVRMTNWQRGLPVPVVVPRTALTSPANDVATAADEAIVHVGTVGEVDLAPPRVGCGGTDGFEAAVDERVDGVVPVLGSDPPPCLLALLAVDLPAVGLWVTAPLEPVAEPDASGLEAPDARSDAASSAAFR
ncbi:hypothetical protein ACSMXN_04045 [Jatrophihabitans sp. DSM 45814]